MYAVAALSLASTIATANEIAVFDRLVVRTGGTTAADVAEAEQLSEGFVSIAFWVGAAAGLLTIMWWHRAHRAVRATGATGLRWSPGWAVGGWFIPVANTVIPKLVLNEIDRVSLWHGTRQGDWRESRLTPLATWWWLIWIAGVAGALVGATIVAGESVAEPFRAGTYRLGLVLTGVGLGLSVVAGFLGAATIRIIGERLSVQ